MPRSSAAALFILILRNKAGERMYGNDLRPEFEKRLLKLEKAKARALALSESEPSKMKRYRMQQCGAYIVFRDYFLREEAPKLVEAAFCRAYKACGICAAQRAAKVANAYADKVALVRSERPELVLAMVTFTIRDSEDLRASFLKIRWAMSELLCRRRHASSRAVGEFRKARGGAYSIEVKRGENSGLWHPHIHCLVLLDRYMDWESLRDEWAKLIGQEWASVHVRKCDPGDDAFREAFKYALKFGALSLEDHRYALGVLSRQRQVGNFGCLRGVQVPEEMADWLPEDDEIFCELLFEFDEVGSSYSFVDERGMDRAPKRSAQKETAS